MIGLDCASGLLLLLDAGVKATVILAVAGMVSLALRGRPAALRHLVWLQALLSLLLVPILVPVLPPLGTIPLPAVSYLLGAQPGVPAGQAAHDVALMPRGEEYGPPLSQSEGAALSATDGRPRWTAMMSIGLPVWIVLVWGAGVTVALLPLWVGSVIVRVRAHRAIRLTDVDWLALLTDLRRQMGISRPVVLLQGGGNIPSTLGLLRPAILLPAAARQWSPHRRRAVLLHELAHVKRADCLAQMMAGLVRAVYWFHPLVWLAVRRLERERERACDDRVLAAGLAPSEYASHLLEIVRSLRTASCPSLAVVAMARRSQFEGRILSILDERPGRRVLRRGEVLLVTALAAVLVAPLVACRAVPSNTGDVAVTLAGSGAERSAMRADGAAILNPSLKYQDLVSYEAAIGQRGILLNSPHLCLLAPADKADAARSIFDRLVKAYDQLHEIVGVHTRHKMAVYHFPPGHPDFSGGAHDDAIWFDYDNLEPSRHAEWTGYGQPHVVGYIEMMADSFLAAANVRFGGAAVRLELAAKVATEVAANPALDVFLANSRVLEAQTFDRYIRGGLIFPPDVESGVCDRIHRHLLWSCEQKYGPPFWPDVFRQVQRRQRELAAAARLADPDQARNERYRITVDCFDSLRGLEFKRMLERYAISSTTDVESLHPMSPAWDRRFVPPSER